MRCRSVETSAAADRVLRAAPSGKCEQAINMSRPRRACPISTDAYLKYYLKHFASACAAEAKRCKSAGWKSAPADFCVMPFLLI